MMLLHVFKPLECIKKKLFISRPESLTLQGVKAEVRNLATDIHRARKDLQRLRTTVSFAAYL